MLKKSIALMMSAALLVGLAGCSSQSGTTEDGGEEKLDVAFIIPGSISDGAFGTMSYQGVEKVQEQPFISKADYIEGISASSDAAKAIRDYVAEGYDVVWAQSGLHSAAVMEIAPEFPETTFVALAAQPEDQEFDNVWFVSQECEGGYYVAGALAAKTTKSNSLGVIGGRENPLYVACAKAFEEGAKSVNPDITVMSTFTGDFNDPIKAKEAAASQIESGADVLAYFVDAGVTGVIAAAEEAEKAGSEIWTIGKGSDQYDLAPEVMLTSVVYDYGEAMVQTLQNVLDGTKSGLLPLDMSNGCVYLADFRGQVPDDVVAEIDALTEQVKAGEVTFTTQYDIE